jgi:2'-5' RNA ligase
MRAFIAIDLDDALRAALVRTRSRLESSAPKDARFTEADKLHLTLRFFADIDDERARTIAAALPKLAERSAPRLDVEGLHAFPSPARGRVIVIAIADAEGTISALASSIEEHVAALEIDEEERAFRPHITIARLKHERDVRAWIANAPIPESGVASALTFYRSELGAAGARHTPIVRCAFTSPAPR